MKPEPYEPQPIDTGGILTAKPFVLSVNVIIHDAQKRCLLLRRSAASKSNAKQWEFPGGKINPGETFDAALLREVREETGLKIALERGFTVGESDLPDRRVLYLLMVAAPLTRLVRLSKEHDQFQWALPQDFDDIDLSPEFRRMARQYTQEIAVHASPQEPKPAFSTPAPQWLARQLAELEKWKLRYKKLAGWLKATLEKGIKPFCPQAQIDARAKAMASVALKIIRKAKYDDPLRQMTDLCGARVIVHLKSEVEAVGANIRTHFHVDNANSLDHLSRLGSDRFGYRSVHFVVEMRPDRPAGIKIPKALLGLKAEIQVRTIAQHAWADIGHDRLYKTGCEIPDIWKREAARVAALLARPLKLNGPVVIVAGACDPFHEKSMRAYHQLLRRAFTGFRGIILSGGTRQGIAGVVGAIAASSNGCIRAIGYLPEEKPRDAKPDNRYAELRNTDGRCVFSAIEPLQNWLDLLASDILPKGVRLLGINGGAIAGLEYRFALALGAPVAVLHESGREADRLTQEWPLAPNSGLTIVPHDPMTIRAFLHDGDLCSSALPPEKVTAAAQILHRDFLEERRYSHPDPVMQPWAKLRVDLQESNRSQIACLESILRVSGFGIRPRSGPVTHPGFTRDEIDAMAEMEHGRWNLERLRSGWQYGQKKDSEKKISPYLVPWRGLEDGIRKYDRKNVCLWPEILAGSGLEIYRLPSDKTENSTRRTISRK